jgi:hypothetical protein
MRRYTLHVSTSSRSSSGELQEKQTKFFICVVLIRIHILHSIVIIIIIIANTHYGQCKQIIYARSSDTLLLSKIKN